jgi:glutathione synthase/RimK-type ligase-like ATP-grasp enzyme
MTVLIISEPGDLHAQMVMKALARRGARDVRMLDFGDFPARIVLDMRLTTGAPGRFVIRLADAIVDMDDVGAVWWRRPQAFGIPEQGMRPEARHFAMAEAATAFQGMWQASRALWVNDTNLDAAASHKPWQLEVARAVGLTIPDTLISTDPQTVLAFWRVNGGDVVYKPFLQTWHAWRETRILRREDLGKIASVRVAPVIFQRLVPGAADLRVTIIGDRVFAAAVDLAKVDYKLDVRLNQQAYERHALPDDVGRKLLALMDRLGLEYGAIDLRLTPAGEYVFFEVNPAGQFLFVEHACGLPISDAMAEHLASGRPARRHLSAAA